MERYLIIEQGYNKYFKIALPVNSPASENLNVEKLLIFIGEHLPYRDRNAVGSAYMAIREKTNELLKIDWRNHIVRTSKREVASIKKIYHSILKNDIGGNTYIKIPYKLEHIFKAIIIIIKEIHDNGYDIPQELAPLVNKTYLLAFYHRHCEAYDEIYPEIPMSKFAQRALNDDLHGPFSSLQTIFK